ncbi:peptidylprolyl isomerase fpr3 [Teratosphaeriaceae sp. CCFEE 6253]|nr:peptidylprolyl isomerase fpr3 [Teratosphaeriaceae sp. CCFEE 6253]
MSGMLPMAMFGQEVIPDGTAVLAGSDIPAAFRITMAAIDPTAAPLGDDGAPQRATLKIIRQPLDADAFYEDSEDSEDDDEDDFDVDEMNAMLGDGSDEDDEDEELTNGGPSDPSKTKKARVQAALKKLGEIDGMDVDDSEDDEAPKTNGVNGVSKKAKGKMPASDSDEDEEIESDDGEDEVEEFVICTLDPQKNYQQTLDLTIGEKEMVFFKVTGTHSIFLTGNYVEPDHDHKGMYDPDDESDEDYDLEPSEDELDDEEMDELDDMEDPRVTELLEEEAPKLIEAPKKAADKKADKKANKKRPAEDAEDAQTLDEMIQKESTTAEPEQKLSKKQLKKQKKNDGTAAAAPAATEVPSSSKADKKVSFAKELEQGPTPTKDAKAGTAATSTASSSTLASTTTDSKNGLGVKTVQGVTLDDKKLGTGPVAKKGDRVGVRYIGKLAKDNKVFDSNKKGKPFGFKVGAKEVIQGWDIGIQGMSIGGERRITIPAHLAYGSKNMGAIPANSTLVFDVKLMEINKGK